MKKIVVSILMMVISIPFLSACSKARQVRSENKILIVYLSRTNNTKAVAGIIHKNVGGTLVALELEKPYPANYQETVQQVAQENETGYLPPLKTKIDSIEKYDVVFLGFPTWGMKLPPPMKSFLHQYDLGGKTVIPFNTNGGYGKGSSFETVRELCPNSKILEGFSMEGGSERDGKLLVIQNEKAVAAEKEVIAWLKKIKWQAQQSTAADQTLHTRQQKIVAIAALTAKGDLLKLKPVLHTALDAGLTVNEIKEIMVHLSAYCGFPRSLNGINTFLAVHNERKARGITDPPGVQASPVSRDGNKYEAGKKNLEKLTGRPESGPKTGYAAFVPVIDTLLKEHLFADIFDRGVLSFQDRELTTVSVLVALGGVDAQLQGHLSISLNVGLTEPQLRQMLAIVETHIGTKEAEVGKAVLDRVPGTSRPN